MSRVKLPQWLQSKLLPQDFVAQLYEQKGQAYQAGAENCYTELLKHVSKFDEDDESRSRWGAAKSALCIPDEFTEGARWQHTEDAAQIVALKAEVETREADVDRLQRWAGELVERNRNQWARGLELEAEIAKLKAEIEALREALK